MIRSALLICIALATASGVSACGSDAKPVLNQPANESGLRFDGDYSGSGPGTLVSATNLPTVDLRLRAITSVAARVTYQSTSGVDDSPTTVSGTVFIPKGKAPEGGWPVIAYGHATTGILEECAPSLSPTLLGVSDLISGLVRGGYAVTMSDYQGLGMKGAPHPYLDATTEGYNLIDSVRAARKLSGDLSDRYVAVGGSQGGQAAWAANELAPKYGNGLTMLGSASFSPPADIEGFADAAAAGQLTEEQSTALMAILESLSRSHPDFKLDDYRHGIVKEKWDVLLSCQGDAAAAAERTKALDEMTPDDLRPSSPEAVEVLRGYLQRSTLPRGAAAAPMLVIYGGQDQFISPVWTDRALERACRMGDVIQIQLQPGAGHGDLDNGAAVAWIAARFNNEPAPDDCQAFLASNEPPAEAAPQPPVEGQ
ncbi:alpha/beta fold hydrolase [Mycolicibacterium sp.]|uniref:alpha/beta fold hydrolase n=1 Tax=Mycolicibacterium sp. TaxID=2320850 RepID=UPI001A355720|nr:alpha/beta fold hydrolase [Mycolicibacterium sp.]MBJ7339083.1 alpha/beta fold hydrolase [Mycolicibacterium sp.]